MSVMRLGYVHARESDLDKAVDYYSNVLGLQEVAWSLKMADWVW